MLNSFCVVGHMQSTLMLSDLKWAGSVKQHDKCVKSYIIVHCSVIIKPKALLNTV